MDVKFEAAEYQPDGSFAAVEYRFVGNTTEGWWIERKGVPHLQLGPGYRLLQVLQCGVCATDLARRYLPFPLPQITGHELLARDAEGQRYVVEINASHHARGVETQCRFCESGFGRHCPDRLVLGIHGLPGGFGPWVLVPLASAIPLDGGIPDGAAVLVEPFAAALNAVTTVSPRSGDTVAVLGPRRLGMLVVCALDAWRRSSGLSFDVITLTRHQHLGDLARVLGADANLSVDGDGRALPGGLADVVIDTTGNPEALELALRLARREVHLKSTHGRSSVGLSHLTELVVDELWIGPVPEQWPADARVAWLSKGDAPTHLRTDQVWQEGSVTTLLDRLHAVVGEQIPRVDLAVVDSMHQMDSVIRIGVEEEVSLVRPGGGILLDTRATNGVAAPLLRAIRERGLRLSSSRCGDFRAALDLMKGNDRLRGIGDQLITHRFRSGVAGVSRAFETAAAPECIKAIVDHQL